MDEMTVHNEKPLGLTTQEAERRRAEGMGNSAPASPSRSEKEIAISHIFTFFNLVFVALAIFLVVAGSSVKNMTFLGVVVCNTVIGIFQEIKAKHAVDRLTLVAQVPVKVLRDGQMKEIPQQELVVGDVIFLAPGDQICADAAVVEGTLQVNESLLTGEADAVEKDIGAELMSGSFVLTGRAKAELTRVGAESYAAKLSQEAKRDPKVNRSEMMRALDILIKVIGFALIPVGALLFWQQLASLGLRKAAESTVAALIGMIPEGLYLLTSVALAASALKLSRSRVLVQDMNCIETLARVDVLCVDKTGTITEPGMEVEEMVPLSGAAPEYLEQVLRELYGAEADNETGRAVQELFGGKPEWQCTRRIPFQSAYKWGGAVFAEQGTFLAGAPEVLMDDRFWEIQEEITPWAEQGMRVLLVCRYEGEPKPGNLDSEAMIPLALIVLSNRIRPEAPETFRYFAQQGVAIKVISGDNPQTVSEVALRAGIENAETYVDARTLETPEDVAWAAENCTVFGRVTPERKRELVQALRAQGHTVAMTGDGVNDVLALTDADCSIAMASGAQAASQVSKLVLLDSDFSAMPAIVGEGRRVINNIQRAATLFLVKNIFSACLAIITLFTLWPYPLVPIHLSVISGLTIGVPSFFLAMEPNYERVSGRFLPGVFRRALPGGLTNVFVVLFAQAFMVVFAMPMEQVSTVCAAILAFVGLLVLFRVCQPFNKFRAVIWGTMGLLILGCFIFLGGFFELYPGNLQTMLVMVTLLIMTPQVYRIVLWCFDKGEDIFLRRKHHADL